MLLYVQYDSSTLDGRISHRKGVRKFGYSEHCVYTGAMFELHMYPILVSGGSILGGKVSGFDFWRFILGARGFLI